MAPNYKKLFDIEILHLSNKMHEYDFDFDEQLFAQFGASIIEKGSGKVKVSLDKTERMITARFVIEGVVTLTCDRSLEEFEYPVHAEESVIYKYGEQAEDISDELQVIEWDTERINIMQQVYDLIIVAIPMKKLHPRFDADAEDDEDELIYTSHTEEDQKPDDEVSDPRFEVLKRLKNGNSN